MAIRRSAELQVLLEGVPLPASKDALLEHARRQDAEAARALESLPDREYRSLDEVGEALAPVQPSSQEHDARAPHEERGRRSRAPSRSKSSGRKQSASSAESEADGFGSSHRHGGIL